MDYIKLDKSSSTPLHQQLCASIKTSIQTKHINPGDKLPTEGELCDHFNISRPVVRQAYNQLLEEGFIFRHKGKGSFVLTQKTKYSILQNLHSLTEQISLNNMSPTIKEYLREVIVCPQNLMKNLGINEPEKILHIKRMYFGDDSPQFYADIYLSLATYPDIENQLKEDQSLRDYTKQMEGLKISVSKRCLTAIKFTPEVCAYFELPKDAAGFKIETTNILNDGRIAEFGYAYIKGLGTSMTIDYF